MRTAVALLLTGLILLAGCTGGRPEPPATAFPTSTISTDDSLCLPVAVVNEEVVPIADAKVFAEKTTGTARTDLNGTATLCGFQDGTYTVLVDANGYSLARLRATLPAETPLHFTLKAVAVETSYHEMLQRTVFYQLGLSTFDATIGRYVPTNQTTCGPCSFEWRTPKLPGVIYWEAQWTRSVTPPIELDDQMYHVFRGGTPYENPAGDTTDRDIGSNAMAQPFHFQYPWNDLVRVPVVAKAAQDGTEVPFSGAMYCWGNPPAPCANQRINVYLTSFYGLDRVPDSYSALPPRA